ncbi:MAG: DUF6602 domain-containing protein [Cyclobacteriaceae bacterium]
MAEETTVQKIIKNYKQLEESIVKQLFIEYTDHSPTSGSYREDVWRSLFRQIIPYKFSIEKGAFIIDSKGLTSKEIDLVIFDEQYTPYIFNYGNIRFIPIEAVAVVIQCKSNAINNSNLQVWKMSISLLKTDTRSITRIYQSVVNGELNKAEEAICEKNKKTQTATRPISILCHLKKQDGTSTKPKSELFDFIICADEAGSQLNIFPDQNKNLGEWYKSLNHHNDQFEEYVKDYQNPTSLKDYEVPNNSILSLIFQLNQLLMLINNPMLFPHQAYVEMFNAHNPKT